MAENSIAPLQVIDRAFIVLECVANNAEMSLNDIHRETGINKASLMRILASLCQNGYVNRSEKTGLYSLSFKAFEVGVKAVRTSDIDYVIRNSLEELSKKHDVIAQFSVEDHDELFCLQSYEEKATSFTVYTRVGQRTPMYSTSAGKAILSTYTNDEIREKWKHYNVRKLSANTITDIDELLKDIALVRQRGYAIDYEECEPGLFCVGTVLLNFNLKPIGAISLSTSELSNERIKELSSALLEHSRRVSYMLGYSKK